MIIAGHMVEVHTMARRARNIGLVLYSQILCCSCHAFEAHQRLAEEGIGLNLREMVLRF